MKPITLYGHHARPQPRKGGHGSRRIPNPLQNQGPRISRDEAISLREANPNGRVPAIEDPNTSLTLWESGAIIEYVVDTYDQQRKVSFKPGTPESYHTKQWLHFQASGQGPYFRQAVWFKIHHKEQLQSALDRYINAIRRVSGVLNGVLQGRQYLVNDKFSFADIAFVPWFEIIPWVAGDVIDLEKDFPNVHIWLKTVKSRPSVKKALGSLRLLRSFELQAVHFPC